MSMSIGDGIAVAAIAFSVAAYAIAKLIIPQKAV